MKKTTFFLLAFLACCMASAQLTVTETVFDRKANEDKFAFGADISWLSQQESWGTYYCNRQGKRADLMDILKEDFGLNAVRFRVWVNPSGGWSGKQDVINLCKRAYAKGLKIMISFHYSDTWADSSNQTIPGQWTDHSAEALAQKVYEHTKDVLSGLKKEGIIPKWVSIGNETKYGMLYETGRTKTTEGMMNFVKFINSGAKAVKEISEDIITIIHLPNAHDEGTARNMFDNLKKYGANYDCIGLSAYPRWSHLDVTTDANITSTINKYLTTFKNLKSRFGKPVMVMETGHYANEPYDANRFLAEFMKALIADGELGCFYWEPEAFDNSGYNLGAWSSATHQATIAMDAYMGIKHTKVSQYATSLLMLPNDTLIFKPGEKVDMNRANEVRPILRKIGDVAQRTGCAIVLIGHLNKATGQQSSYRGLGSVDFTAGVRSVLVIGKSKDDPNLRIMVHDKSSLAPPGTSIAFILGDEDGFRWIGDYDITADELLSGIEKKKEPKLHEAIQLVCELLADGKEIMCEEIDRVAHEKGISSRTVRDAKKELGEAIKSRIITVDGKKKKLHWME